MQLAFETDPTGFPMVWVDTIDAYLHWLPVTTLQWEWFLCETADPHFDAGWYDRLLGLSPRVTPSRIGPDNYWHSFLTGIVPSEAQAFAAWCGESYALPTLEQWLRAYAQLKSLPGEAVEPPAPTSEPDERLGQLLTRVESARAATAAGLGRRTLADQMLLRLGVLEWVEQNGHPPRWVGIGELPPAARGGLTSPERGPVVPNQPETERSSLFGIRLLRRRS
jgi:hypothetical protein